MGNLASAKAVTFLDIETTHLDPRKSAILQISFITDWEDGNQDRWSTKIKPKSIELEFASQEALKICNYSEKEWANAPSFNQIAEEISKRLTWGPLVAHNINFDLAHIRAVFKRYKWTEVDSVKQLVNEKKCFKVGYPIIDTCALAYLFLPTEKQNLNELRQYFNIKTEGAHEAVKDTEDCREVFLSNYWQQT
jgi:DNA polymerase III epsilon subunit-like protein